MTRIGSGDPVRSSIDFARFTDGPFGWGVVDPGHGLSFARADRPLDAAAAAPLSASGTFGPLILVSNADTLDPPVVDYLLDIQPGYSKDPVRGVYNHGWIIGDDKAISVGVQSRIDLLLEITQRHAVQAGFAVLDRHTMSEAEHPIRRSTDHSVTLDDVRQLMGASTPHFALQIRNRIARLIAGLPPGTRPGSRASARSRA